MSKNLVGVLCNCAELDSTVIPFKRVLADTEEWNGLMTERWTKQADNPASKLRDQVSPNWRNEDVYLVAFADGRPNVITKKELWEDDEFKVFEDNKKDVFCCPVGCVREV